MIEYIVVAVIVGIILWWFFNKKDSQISIGYEVNSVRQASMAEKKPSETTGGASESAPDGSNISPNPTSDKKHKHRHKHHKHKSGNKVSKNKKTKKSAAPDGTTPPPSS
ncbi:unnamed protein product [Bursaphelenchus okinawaensis]|uniref:Uncharacterized protein n=1 Tax=Bursaphelenchus okinawaensis TaxID=465554 RepID=A0A811JS97_9BILA|nr:unnamed protein product [Bursaphelenchus okinawaensis]CAG9081262.1 unnamed protein product [Bursaphelenchus okinawaensis]